MATDPVCGMAVDERPESLQFIRENRTYYFCSSACRESFARPDETRRRLGRRLLLAWPLTVAVVLLAYLGPSREDAVGQLVLAGVVQVYVGRPFYRGAWEALRGRIGNMDLLIAVGTTAAYGYSAAALALPAGLAPAYYFDASSLIVTLILTGSYLEQLTRARAGSALSRLGELLPTRASVVLDTGEVRSVALADLSSGETIRVAPGARFPADGTVRDGRTSVDEAILTGEPGWVAKAPGSRVLAGSVNREGPVEVTVSAVGPDSFVAQVGALISEAEMSRVPLRQLADRLAAVFVPLVLALAVGAALFWHLVGGASLATSLLVFVTVAVTACPCAFGIATPAAILVGTGRAAEEGILFRGRDAIEKTARIDTVLADKTGTLTSGTPSVVAVRPIPPRSEGELLSAAAGLSAGIDHPLSAAIRAAAAARGVVAARASEVRLVPGRGVEGAVDGRRWALWQAAEVGGVDLAAVRPALTEIEGQGASASVVVEDGRAVGVLGFAAELAPGARAAVSMLLGEQMEVAMVTGDQEGPARVVADALGIRRVFSGLSPAGKVALVDQLRREGRRVAFVGDGVNDAAALAAADVGMAIGAGTDVAREAGQVVLVRPDLRAVPSAIAWARRTVARVRGNLVWAVGYNAVLLPVAAGALVPWWGLGIYRWLPVAGALAMALSSTTVVLNSLWLRRAVPEAPGSARSARETVWPAPA